MRLIDADDLNKALTQLVKSVDDCYEYAPIDFRELIDNAPTVEPFEPDYVGAERLKARQRGYEEGYHFGMEIGKTLNPKIKQGEWIVYDHDAPIKFCKCSLCGRYEEIINFKNYPYCHCGAKMKGGGEEPDEQL